MGLVRLKTAEPEPEAPSTLLTDPANDAAERQVDYQQDDQNSHGFQCLISNVQTLAVAAGSCMEALMADAAGA